MCSAPHDPEFLAKLAQAKDDMTSRMNNYISAWNRGDLETAMDFFVDDGLDYSDYSTMRPHMDKTALREFFTLFSRAVTDIKVETLSVHGAHDFCVWESFSEFLVVEELEGMPFKQGEKATLLCASLIWWNADGKIVREVDYAVWKK